MVFTLHARYRHRTDNVRVHRAKCPRRLSKRRTGRHQVIHHNTGLAADRVARDECASKIVCPRISIERRLIGYASRVSQSRYRPRVWQGALYKQLDVVVASPSSGRFSRRYGNKQQWGTDRTLFSEKPLSQVAN